MPHVLEDAGCAHVLEEAGCANVLEEAGGAPLLKEAGCAQVRVDDSCGPGGCLVEQPLRLGNGALRCAGKRGCTGAGRW